MTAVRVMKIETFALKMPRAVEQYQGTAGTPVSLSSQTRGESDYHWVSDHQLLYSRRIESLVVKVTTDTGLVGWGEAQVPIAPEVPKTIVDSVLTPLVVGEDALAIDVLWHKMYNSLRGRGHRSSFMLDAISAVDIALWDLAGKFYGAPVYQLLGGAFSNPVGVYHSGLPGESPDEKVAHALRIKEAGYRALKVFVGRGVDQDINLLRKIREAVGPEFELMVDALWSYDVTTAERLGFALDELGVTVIEAPIPVEDVEGHRHLASRLCAAIAEGETERNRHPFLTLFQRRAIDLVQPDIGRTGITEGRKILQLAETFNLPASLHMAIGQFAYIAASAHMAVATPNLRMLEMNPVMFEAARKICRGTWRLEDGILYVPDDPGLGIDLDEHALQGMIAS